MKLSQILTEAAVSYPDEVPASTSSGLGRSCDYCPSEALFSVFDRYVCSQHEKTAHRDWEDGQKRRPKLNRIASQEQSEQPDISDDDDDDEELNAGLPDVEGGTDDLVQGVIRKEGGKWCVRSEKNPDWNGGCFASKGAAEKRLKQVEFFKHKGGFFHEGEFFQAKTDGVYWFDTRQGSWLPWRMWVVAEGRTPLFHPETSKKEVHPEISDTDAAAVWGKLLKGQGKVFELTGIESPTTRYTARIYPGTTKGAGGKGHVVAIAEHRKSGASWNLVSVPTMDGRDINERGFLILFKQLVKWSKRAKQQQQKTGSAIGIQHSLGADHPKRAAGILFVCQGRVLLVRRAYDENNPDIWSIPGGHIKLAHDGMPQDAWGNAKREVKEEMGGLPPGIGRATRKHRAISKSGNTYVTYVVELPPGAMKWRPYLNPEHAAYRWCNRKQAKALKLHPNVKRVLKNSDIWDGKFYSTVTIHLERDAQNLGTIMQEGAQQIETINAAAQEVYGQMGKDFQYVRLELTTVVHGPPGYIPVSGVAGVLRQGSAELFFQTSISPRNGNLRVLLTTRKTGLKTAATFRSAKGIARWVTRKLAEHVRAPTAS